SAAVSPLAVGLTSVDYRSYVESILTNDRARLAVRVRAYTLGVSCSQWRDAMRVRGVAISHPSPRCPEPDPTVMLVPPAYTRHLLESRPSALFGCGQRSACSSATATRSRS